MPYTKHLLLPAVALGILISSSSCNNTGHAAQTDLPPALPEPANYEPDTLAQYRDTLVGRFNGIDIDTLICEPLLPKTDTKMFGEFFFEWRLYTTKGTVDDIIIGNTVAMRFIPEGDLDGNGTEEWGFINQWVSSSWTSYYTFTYDNGRWKTFVDRIPVWWGHIEDMELDENDIVRPSDKKGFVKVKKSDAVYEDDMIYAGVIDTIYKITPEEYSYELDDW